MKHGSLAEERPDLVRQWSTCNELSPNEVSCGSHKKVLWNCENGHTWSATVKNRALSGSNCPYCEHRTILSGFNDLATLRPDLGRSWSKKNHIKPNEVSISSCTRVYWNCENGHEWKARIADRTSGRGCPYCAGHLVWKGFNDLATTNPELIAEWSKKNTSISPDNVTAKNSTNVWWRCQKCGNTYQAVIKAKANGRHSCPWKKIKTGVRASYFASCTRTYEYYIEHTLGKTMLKNVTYSMVVMFLENLAKSRNLRYGTLRNIVLVLSMVFDLAVRDDVIRHNPCKGCLKELKREYGKITKLVRSLTIEEQRVFETFLSESKQFHRWSPVFTVMMWTGMRAGEVLGLRWDDVDFENNEINVNHIFVDYSLGKGKDHVYTINPPKTRNSYRSIPMLPKVRAALLEEKENHELLGIKCISNIDGYTDFVFLNSLGKIMTGKDLNQALNRIRDAINKEIMGGKDYHINWFPHVHNHMLRHTFATRMREAGADMKATSDIMGHDGILITLKTYTDASRDFKTREITVLDDYYKNVQ